MTVFDIGEIGQLATQIAVNGAIRLTEQGGDAVFELIVGVVELIYESSPM